MVLNILELSLAWILNVTEVSNEPRLDWIVETEYYTLSFATRMHEQAVIMSWKFQYETFVVSDNREGTSVIRWATYLDIKLIFSTT